MAAEGYVRHIKIDYSKESLRDAFKDQDAVISTISSTPPPRGLSAISAAVKVFFPSKFGIDTSDSSASEYVPFLVDKLQTVDYLKVPQDKVSRTAVITGSMFDWSWNVPGFGRLNVPAGTVTVFD
ncbi:hypothetical protein N7537_008452 [Penicillium hordei]|uniref:NmrA-like domain-containing protein n=1 Tax=Penicillium hordei TaxID=40994 RepID=A0AAD6H1M5_9EURO|nr:uncharacterized protein N7537_008452 [Penicillium hordei]KAJ5598368.1 hypothetical protein N7537_008452 [Penicillium hordei]